MLEQFARRLEPIVQLSWILWARMKEAGQQKGSNDDLQRAAIWDAGVGLDGGEEAGRWEVGQQGEGDGELCLGGIGLSVFGWVGLRRKKEIEKAG